MACFVLLTNCNFFILFLDFASSFWIQHVHTHIYILILFLNGVFFN